MRLGLNRHSMFAFFFNQTSARVELKLTSVTCKIDHELRQIRCARNRFVIDYCWLKIDCKKILPLSRKGFFAFFCDLVPKISCMGGLAPDPNPLNASCRVFDANLGLRPIFNSLLTQYFFQTLNNFNVPILINLGPRNRDWRLIPSTKLVP